MQRQPLPDADTIKNLPADGGPEFNRLIHESSPYLLQHARNPVNWHPWGDEAKARARAEDKPIFLSIGYSTCHWCHVMEHESFENEEIAGILNRDFIPVKVDREERPDLDDLYMVATQLMTGRGGWPNSVWLLPDGRPWYAGTYFPPDDRGGRIGFKTLLTRLSEIWRTRRADVEAQANQLSDAIRRHAQGASRTQAAPGVDDLLNAALDTWRQTYDIRHGGFGDAPKFPPHSALELILYHSEKQRDPALLNLATGTLNAMALGGIHDHIGGGFHRYSTDAEWLVPHFEKMLYDNALLARVYAEAFRVTGNALHRDVAQRTLDWILREMTGPEGAFYSALDADSEGEEGLFYIWHRNEILEALGNDDGEFFCHAYQITEEGNYFDEATGRATGMNIPHLSAWPKGNDDERLARCRATLLDVRSRRIRPGLDDKRIVSWNGLAVAAFARAGAILSAPHYHDAAARAAKFLLAHAMPNGELMRTWRNRQARIPAFLEDYAALADGLLALHAADGNPEWLNAAEELGHKMLDRFADSSTGQFFATSEQHESLLTRFSDCFDSPLPSATALAIRVLTTLSQRGRDPAFATFAARAFTACSARAALQPSGCAALILAGLQLGSAAALPHIEIQLTPAATKVSAANPVEIQIRAIVPEGWKLQADKTGHLFNAEVSGDFTLAAQTDSTLSLRLHSAHSAPTARATVHLTYSACNDTICLPPVQHSQSFEFPIQPDT